MPKPPYRPDKPHRSLAMPIAAALVLKAVALVVIYLAFFVPPMSTIPAAERAATGILGLSGR